ncbi:hypothetical protein BH11BAC6_BH11BAC6_02280 [soil metagenome]
MQDNSTNDDMELLIRYMDGELNPKEAATTEKMLQHDAALQERLDNLLAARQAIKSLGVKQYVQSLHAAYYNKVQAADDTTAKIIKPAFGFKMFMRIAAVFILVVAGYGVYEFNVTSNAAVFNDNYIGYQLPVTRGSAVHDNIDSLYNANAYDAVIATVSAEQQKDQKDYFLVGQAYLNTNNAGAAIDAFNKVVQLNSGTAVQYFAQETDYYLALAYIKAGDIDAAEKQLDKIKSNKQHMFYSKAKEISTVKLMILKMK